MTVTDETLSTLAAMRYATAARVDSVTQDLELAWARAWNEVSREWEDAVADLVAASQDGKWPSPTKVRRAKRAMAALETTRKLLDDLGGMVPARIVADLDVLVEDVTAWQRRLAATQYPPTAGGTAVVAATLERVDPDAIRAIVERVSGNVRDRTWPLSTQAEAAMRSTLIRGITVGNSPETAAREMVNRVRGDFNGGLNRARVIARTELLDAHRAAGRAQQDRLHAAGVVTGWTWMANLDIRTCPSCIAMHGTEHPASVAGPLDHQQGRCDRLPKTASWADLGFPDIEEPPSILPDARAWFDDLPQSDRERIMGATRLELLDSGAVKWEDLATRRETPDWRPSYAPTPVGKLA